MSFIAALQPISCQPLPIQYRRGCRALRSAAMDISAGQALPDGIKTLLPKDFVNPTGATLLTSNRWRGLL
jgi:hypothetical protein